MSQPQPATLRLFGFDQGPLPGMDHGLHAIPPASPAGNPDADSPAIPALPVPGQLCLGPNQMLLWDADPEPRQPSLLPHPAPWELPPPATSGRQALLPGRAPEMGPPDQLRLFGAGSARGEREV